MVRIQVAQLLLGTPALRAGRLPVPNLENAHRVSGLASNPDSKNSGSESRSHAAPSAIILAAGMGKRMKSDLPKVLHPIGGRPMVCAVIDACREAGCRRIVLVIGHRQELVREAIAKAYGPNHTIEFGLQPEQLGTGHAVRCVENQFLAEKAAPGNQVFVLAGDGPLIRSSTLSDLLSRHRAAHAAATLATSVIPDPSGYGRIVRDKHGAFAAIVEQKTARPRSSASTR